jgi:sialate O-acetylesterase
MRSIIHTVALLLISGAACAAQLQVAPTLSSHMVLQRDQPILIWGTAEPGAAVRVNFNGERAETKTTEDGTWQVELQARPASATAAQLEVESGKQKIALSGLLIGDVWFCAGQSNMAMKVNRKQLGKGPVNSQIRFLSMVRGPFTKPIVGAAAKALRPTPENKQKFYKVTGWRQCSASSAATLSAVAYWFAHTLQPEIGVPIGLIVPPVGGSAAQAWVSRASIEADPSFRPLLSRWIDDEPERLQKQLGPWVAAHPNASFDETPLHRHRPTTLFETAVEPMRRHAIKGVIWYQGEQNAQNAIQANWYAKAYPAIVADFRQNWGQQKLPFYSVQLPGFGDPNWPAFREQQRKFAAIPNTGLAVTIDLGDAKNIHPKDKPPVGHRLALLALSLAYGKDIIATGPTPRQISAKGDVVSIRFESVGKGLKANADKSIPSFELAEADGVFKPAGARITSVDTVELRASGIATPRHVRYAWAPFPRPLTFANSADLPAGPFLEPVPN